MKAGLEKNLIQVHVIIGSAQFLTGFLKSHFRKPGLKYIFNNSFLYDYPSQDTASWILYRVSSTTQLLLEHFTVDTISAITQILTISRRQSPKIF